MQYAFGSGVLYGRETTSNAPTPVRFGGLQGATVDIAFTQKELYGQYQFPIALARGTAKITGRASFAQFNAQSFNDLFFGQSAPATGSVITQSAEAQTISSNNVTVSHNGANVFLRDLGVVLASDGTIFTRATSITANYQYTVNETTGNYTFCSNQNNANVKVSYQWNDTSNGKTITMTNQLLGTSPQFLVVLTEVFQSKKLTLTLNACMSSKLTLATRLEDFIIPDFDFSAFADSSDTIGKLSMDE